MGYTIKWFATDGAWYETSPKGSRIAAWAQYQLILRDFEIPGPVDQIAPQCHGQAS